MSQEPYAAKLAEIDRNLAAFLQVLPSLMTDHKGEWTLMRDREIVGFYPDAPTAQITGNQLFPDGVFSIQPVRDDAEHLGRYTYALAPRLS